MTSETFGIHIREFYKPLQPTLTNCQKGVTYHEIVPDKSLQHLVYCYWELYSDESVMEPFTYAVVADGCIDVFFNTKNFEDILIMGYCKEHVSFDLGSRFHYIGIRFLPGMLPITCGIKASTLSNQVLSLKDNLPFLAELLTTSMRHNSKPKFDFTNLDSVLQSVSKASLQTDDRFTESLLTILKRKGDINNIKDISIGISPRQLRRLFSDYIGTSPKNFSKVIRFQHILTTYYRMEHCNVTYFDSGYYDQAHFIKDFRNFYGITPSQALSRSME